MKSPIDVVKGEIVSVDPDGWVNVRCRYDDYHTFFKREYKECLVQMVDSRRLSDKQRRSCYALLKQISDFTGLSLEQTKNYTKLKFMCGELNQTADQIFSLANAPMSLVCAFQRFLVRFIIEFDIPCSVYLVDMVDDIDDYMYGCMLAKKCCICGAPADLHHIDCVGMGNDRTEIVHLGMRAITLCRQHHMEAHGMTRKDFFEKYHLNPNGIVLDKELCRVHKLNTRRKNNAE